MPASRIRELRIELMNQVTYFLPHLLALSTSSPFWEGFDTGLKAFRPTIFGNLPRSGLPEQFESFADWSEMLGSSPRPDFATTPPRSGGTFARAPSTRRSRCASATCARASKTRSRSPRSIRRSWPFSITCAPTTSPGGRYRRIFLAENKWRAQRYGIQGSLADLGRRTLVPLPELIEELIGLLGEHARELGCLAQVEHARDDRQDGTSADHQLRVYKAALEAGPSEHEAQIRVVDWLIEASLEGVSA